MELFHNDGHLSDEGLHAILEGSLSELENLEASEHLGYCVPCLERYLSVLEAGELMQPETPLKDSILRRIGRRARRVFFSRFATVAAAACLVLAFGGSGLYTSMVNPQREGRTPEASQSQNFGQEPGPSLATRLSQATAELPNTLFGWLSPQESNGTPDDDQNQNQPSGQGEQDPANSAPAGNKD